MKQGIHLIQVKADGSYTSRIDLFKIKDAG